MPTRNNDESKFNESFKALRNALRSFKRDELLLSIIHTLRKNEGIPFEEYAKGKPLPWTMLTLIKLTCEFAGQNANPNKATVDDFIKLYRRAYDLEGIYGTTILKESFQGFFLLQSHLQFWHQREIIRSAFARIDYLFCSDKSKESINSWFAGKFGLDIKSFSEMLVATWIAMKLRKDFSFNILHHLSKYKYNTKDIATFLNSIAIDIDNATTFVRDRAAPIKSYFLQFGERTPFILAPLLRISQSDYIPISLRLLERSLTTFIFESIKQSGEEQVIKAFADIFEEYAKELLIGAKLNPLCSTTLEQKYSGKTTDFLTSCGTATLFIECKSIRLSPLAIANPTNTVVLSDIQDSICKAILQCYELASEISNAGDPIDAHLIIVTYDDIHLGEPTRTWESLLKNHFAESGLDVLIPKVLAPEKIFIVGIQEFEQLCEYSQGPNWMGELLAKAVQNNATPETAKHTLLMHVDPASTRTSMPFISNHYRTIFKRLTNRL